MTTMTLGAVIETGANNVSAGEHKPLKDFYKFSTLKEGHLIEGIYKGKFKSTKNPDSSFHIFLAKDGESYGYGDNKVFQERIDYILEKEKEAGGKLYATIIFNGKKTGKNGRGYYSFSNPTLRMVTVNTTSTNNSEIPF